MSTGFSIETSIKRGTHAHALNGEKLTKGFSVQLSSRYNYFKSELNSFLNAIIVVYGNIMMRHRVRCHRIRSFGPFFLLLFFIVHSIGYMPKCAFVTNENCYLWMSTICLVDKNYIFFNCQPFCLRVFFCE